MVYIVSSFGSFTSLIKMVFENSESLNALPVDFENTLGNILLNEKPEKEKGIL
ncbi:hypothetical protein ACFL1R_08280 [Candidatus Latescibacterota bacterium]